MKTNTISIAVIAIFAACSLHQSLIAEDKRFSYPDGAFTCNDGSQLVDPSDILNWVIFSYPEFDVELWTSALTSCQVSIFTYDGARAPGTKKKFENSCVGTQTNLFGGEFPVADTGPIELE